MIQVASFKTHRASASSGWRRSTTTSSSRGCAEPKIIVRFWIVSIVCWRRGAAHPQAALDAVPSRPRGPDGRGARRGHERARRGRGCCSRAGARVTRHATSARRRELGAEALAARGAVRARAARRSRTSTSAGADLVVVSPGVPLRAAVACARARERGRPGVGRGRAGRALPPARRAGGRASPAPTARAPPPRCSARSARPAGSRPSSAATSGRRSREAVLEPARRTPTCVELSSFQLEGLETLRVHGRRHPQPHPGPPGPLRRRWRPTPRPRRASSEPGAGRLRGGQRRRRLGAALAAAARGRAASASPCGPAAAAAGLGGPAVAGRGAASELRVRRASRSGSTTVRCAAATTCENAMAATLLACHAGVRPTAVQARAGRLPRASRTGSSRCATLRRGGVGERLARPPTSTRRSSALAAFPPGSRLVADRRREGEGRALRPAGARRRVGKVRRPHPWAGCRRHRSGVRRRVCPVHACGTLDGAVARARGASRAPATWCCSRRPAPPTTSSGTSRTAGDTFRAPGGGALDELRRAPAALARAARRTLRAGAPRGRPDPARRGAGAGRAGAGDGLLGQRGHRAGEARATASTSSSGSCSRPGWACWPWPPRVQARLPAAGAARLSAPAGDACCSWCWCWSRAWARWWAAPAAGSASRALSLQPAEIAKFTWVVYLAYSLAKKREKVAIFSIGFLPHLAAGRRAGGAVHGQPDFGSAVELLVPALRPALRRGHEAVLPGRLGAAGAAARLPRRSPTRRTGWQRIIAFLDPWAHRHDIGYQVAAVAHLGRLGRLLRPRPGREPAEALLPPRGPHRLHLQHHRRGAGPLRRGAPSSLLYGIIVWRGTRAALRAQRDLRHLPRPRAHRAARRSRRW